MTDNEIVKALECCTNEHLGCEDGCPYADVGCYDEDGFLTIPMKDALDLINHQRAEIERLQKIIVGFMDEVGTWSNKYDVDVSNIHKLPILAKEDWNIRNNIKSEAIKKFWSKLKTHSRKMQSSDFSGEFWDKAILVEDGDNLVKEMVGEKDV